LIDRFRLYIAAAHTVCAVAFVAACPSSILLRYHRTFAPERLVLISRKLEIARLRDQCGEFRPSFNIDGECSTRFNRLRLNFDFTQSRTSIISLLTGRANVVFLFQRPI
jgi:hypothetical protein